MGAAISEVEIVADGIGVERKGDAETGVAVAEWEDGFGRYADELVADQIGVGEAVRKAALVIAIGGGRKAIGFIDEGQAGGDLSKREGIACVDQAVADHIDR